MSLIPFTTQIGPQLGENNTQNSQRDGARIVFVYTERMTERQTINMKSCQLLLRQNLDCIVRQANDLHSVPPRTRLFVLPYRRDDIFEKIRKRFDRPMVYLPRAILEARGHYNVKLPSRSLAISLALSKSQIFVVRTCDSPILRTKINEMTGKIVTSFNDSGTNVVLTNRADDKYCARAFKRDIPVVSSEWIDIVHENSLNEDVVYHNQDAMLKVKEYQIKPFYGLYFKIMVKNISGDLKTLITQNQGHLVYGNQSITTHLVDQDYVDPTKLDDHSRGNNGSDKTNTTIPKIKIVNEDFLFTCAKFGYYLTNKEYQEHLLLNSKVIIKQEFIESSPISSGKQENFTPPQSDDLMNDSFESFDGSNGKLCNNSNQPTSVINNSTPSMLPPPALTTSRSLKKQKQKQQLENESDMILRALNTFDTAQTQHASTQMRKLPDPQLKIEETIEPSQQLFWSADDCDRRRKHK